MAQRAEGSHKGSNAKSVSKTLEILSTFNELAPEQRTSDIANKLHMNISTVSRHLNTMLDWNFLERDDSTGYYSLGLEIVALAGAALQNNDVYRHAYPELQQLSYKYGVHSHMGVPRACGTFDQYLLRKYHGIVDSDGTLSPHVLFRYGAGYAGLYVPGRSAEGASSQ